MFHQHIVLVRHGKWQATPPRNINHFGTNKKRSDFGPERFFKGWFLCFYRVLNASRQGKFVFSLLKFMRLRNRRSPRICDFLGLQKMTFSCFSCDLEADPRSGLPFVLGKVCFESYQRQISRLEPETCLFLKSSLLGSIGISELSLYCSSHFMLNISWN